MPVPVFSPSSVDQENVNPNIRYFPTAKPSKSHNPLDWLSDAQREIDEEAASKAQKKYTKEHEKLLAIRNDELLAREISKQFESQLALEQEKEKINELAARKLAEELAKEVEKENAKLSKKQSALSESDLKLAKKLHNEELKKADMLAKKSQRPGGIWSDSIISVVNDGIRVRFFISLPQLDNANVNFEHDDRGNAQLSISAKPLSELKESGGEQEFGISLLLAKQDDCHGIKEFDLKEEDIQVDYNEKSGLLQIWCSKVKLAGASTEEANTTKKSTSGGWIKKLKAALLKK